VLRKLLGLDDGWGAAAGTLLLIGFGCFVLFISVADLREAARVKPEERSCESWLKDPSGPRWVSLKGCQLDLPAAASRKWKGWRSVLDGGVSGERYLELFVPIYVGAPSEEPRAVLATSNPELLALVDGIDAVPPNEVDAYLEGHQGAFRTQLSPETLTGYVEPVKSLASRSALGLLMAEDAVVLEQGREPPRANALFGLLMGLVCIALGVRSLARRWLVLREQ